jgi:tRNA(His) guanylyltransferase
MDPDAFEISQRRREWFHSMTVPAGLWTVLRVDGRGFSKLTEARFTKPYDELFRDHMLVAATSLATDFGAAYCYTQSDEISVVLAPAFDGFGRGVDKLVSVSAGIASAAFTASAGSAAHFDSRVWIGASIEEVVDYFSWRQSDAARSALNNWCYWTLRNAGCTAREATKALDGLGTSAKNELLFSHGINFNDVPAWQRRGIGLTWEGQEYLGIDPRNGAQIVTMRRRLKVDLDLPIKDAYRSDITALLASA